MAERGGDGVRYRSGREPAKLLNEIDMVIVLMVEMVVKRVAEKRGLTRRRVKVSGGLVQASCNSTIDDGHVCDDETNFREG